MARGGLLEGEVTCGSKVIDPREVRDLGGELPGYALHLYVFLRGGHTDLVEEVALDGGQESSELEGFVFSDDNSCGECSHPVYPLSSIWYLFFSRKSAKRFLTSP